MKFEYNIETEVTKLAGNVIRNILNGFYVKNGWYIELFSPDNLHRSKRSIILPQFNYKEILRKSDGDKSKLIEALTEELCKLKLNTKILESEFEEKFDHFKNLTDVLCAKTKIIIPFYSNLDLEVIIRPSYFGSYGSFHTVEIDNVTNQAEIKLYPRFDYLNENTIKELFSSSITYTLIKDNNAYSWRESEALSDFFYKYVFESTE